MTLATKRRRRCWTFHACRGLALAWWALRPVVLLLGTLAFVAAIAYGMALLFVAR